MPTKPKKRGHKPGVKVRPYRTKNKILVGLEEALLHAKNYSPAPVLTLCGQLEDSILLLENRISNAIAKINSLM